MGTHTKRVHARCTGAVAARGCSVCVWDARLLHSPPQARPRGNWCIRREERASRMAVGMVAGIWEMRAAQRAEPPPKRRRRRTWSEACQSMRKMGSSSRPYKSNKLNTDDAQKSTSS